MKAKAQLNRSFDASDVGDFEESALWAAVALELLGKAALSKISPLLIADPTDDGRSLLVAAGVSSDFPRFKSITAKAVFSRCARAFPPFRADGADQVAHARNADLHSGSNPFSGLDTDTWWESYWSLAILLVHAYDETIESLVGHQRAQTVEEILARQAANVDQRTKAMIERAKQRIVLAAGSADGEREIKRLAGRLLVLHNGDFFEECTCPACGQTGILAGSDVQDGEVVYDGKGGAWEQVEVFAELFGCEYCGLELGEPQYLTAAGLPDSFHAKREYEPVWDDYGND